jgi:trk system potassium uptake protein TrkA
MAKESVFVIIGLGAFGRQLCETLVEKRASVIAVDSQPELIDRVKDSVTQAVRIDATDEDSLNQLSFDDVRTAVVAIGDNVEASILTTALLKRIGVPHILARAVSDIHAQVLKQVGADEVVNLEIDEGRNIASRLAAPEILDNTPISESISIAELPTPSSILGRELLKLDLRRRYRINIIAVKRVELGVDEVGNPQKQETVIFPEPGTVLQERDVLLLVGKNEDIERFKEQKQ